MTDQTTDGFDGWAPDEIVEALRAGKLNLVLGGDPDRDALIQRAKTGVLGSRDIERLGKIGELELIEQARSEGRLDPMLGFGGIQKLTVDQVAAALPNERRETVEGLIEDGNYPALVAAYRTAERETEAREKAALIQKITKESN